MKFSPIDMTENLNGWYFNLNSNQQMQEFLYEFLKVKPLKEKNEKGNYSVNEETLTYYAENKAIEFCKLLIAYRKLEKARGTYLADIARNISIVDWLLHPNFWMNTTVTFRSCLAKGTMIDTVRNISKFPKGIPIEDVKKGDYVYCYNNKLEPQIKKVLWSGKTGFQKVIRIHWQAGQGRKGFLDCTPEHKIRCTSGKYIQAKDLLKFDLRSIEQSKNTPKASVLALSRTHDELYFTKNTTKHKRGIKEHRFIYQQLIGSLTNKDIIHHKDNNHLNHELFNLEKTNLSKHGKIHNQFIKPLVRLKNKIVIKRGWKEGRYTIRSGSDSFNYLNLTKKDCIFELFRIKGKISKSKYSFNTFKYYLQKHNINIKTFQLKFNDNGKYIAKSKILKLISNKNTHEEIQRILKIGYYKLNKLLKYYNIDYQRTWSNQYYKKMVSNHIITKIEWINKYTDVYDLKIEDCHNFIANEICVHNSSSQINFQNIPKHGEIIIGLAYKLIRRLFALPYGGPYILGEVDYDGAEVKVAGMLGGDPQMQEDLNNNMDMHSHWAIELFGLKGMSYKEVKAKYDDTYRFLAKNNFTFADIFGASNISIAQEMRKSEIYKKYVEEQWKKLPATKKSSFDSFYVTFSENQVAKCQDARKEKYPVYTAWQESIVKKYYAEGYVENPFGFRRRYPLKRNEIINMPIQSTSFLLLLDALIRAEELMEKDNHFEQSYIIGQIHDSAMNKIYKPETMEYKEMLDDMMINKPHLPWTHKIKMGTSWSFGYTWFDLKRRNIKLFSNKNYHILNATPNIS